jgi:hypothetical protein
MEEKKTDIKQCSLAELFEASNKAHLQIADNINVINHIRAEFVRRDNDTGIQDSVSDG